MRLIVVMRREVSERALACALIAPTFAIVLSLNLYPILYSFWISLERLDLEDGPAKFAGLGNYLRLLDDPVVRLAIWHTLYFTVTSLGLQSLIGLGIALVLNADFCGRGLVRTLVLLPWAVPTVANATLWQWIYHPDYGVLSTVLFDCGLISRPVQWLGNPYLAMNMVILADTWKVTPFYAIMFLAALQSIPDELYQAAAIDGAGMWGCFLNVTVPFLKPMFMIVLVLRTIEALRVFDIIYVLTGGGPGGATTVLGWVAFLQAFQNLDFGAGAAAANLIVVGACVIATFYARVLRHAAFAEG
jgi:ABC-type sugar transport system permease subunit